MATGSNRTAAEQTAQRDSRQGSQRGFIYLPLIAGWLIPGAGHFLLGKWKRGALLMVSIVCMFALGLAMHGKLYTGAQDILDMLGMVGDLGNGLLFFIGRALGLGGNPEQITVENYGKIFIVVAGLLNIIAAVDAHNLRTGRKS